MEPIHLTRWAYKVHCSSPELVQNALPTPVTTPTLPAAPAHPSMLASTLPRPKHTQNASISFPMNRSNSDLASPTFFDRSSSQKGHRIKSPSISTPMHWLSRQSSKNSNSSQTKHTPTISEPRLVYDTGTLRGGALGSGAMVVRTPDEALKDSGVRLDYDGPERITPVSDVDSASPVKKTDTPLPPIPLEDELEQNVLSYVDELPEDVDQIQEEAEFEQTVELPARARPPIRSVPEPPRYSATSSRSSLKLKSPIIEEHPPFPPLPAAAHVPASPVQPDFSAILLSEIPGPEADRSKVIVALETCTETYRTTYDTLTSRQSHLGDYLLSLIPPSRSRQDSNASSVYSTDSAAQDVFAYRRHLASQGLMSSEATYIHIFVDRPSAPYNHILSYLRTPPTAADCLPRAIRLQALNQTRLDTLVEVRDEASFLGLQSLLDLCNEELKHWQMPPVRRSDNEHSRGQSSTTLASVHSMQASVHSLRAISKATLSNSHESPYSAELESLKEERKVRSPPTPQSWNGRSHSRSRSRNAPIQEPPAGWI